MHWAKGAWITGIVNDASVATYDDPTQSFFTDVSFLPLIELADYARTAVEVPTAPVGEFGIPTKQDRIKVRSIHLDLNFTLIPVNNGASATPITSWYLAWYIFKGSYQDVANAVALGGVGLLRYDPVSAFGQFLHDLPLVRFGSRNGFARAAPTAAIDSAQWNIPTVPVKQRFKTGLSLKTDEELYLVFSAVFAGGLSEDIPPVIAVSGNHRCNVID